MYIYFPSNKILIPVVSIGSTCVCGRAIIISTKMTTKHTQPWWIFIAANTHLLTNYYGWMSPLQYDWRSSIN